MPELYDVAAIGNAIVDVIAPSSDGFLDDEGLTKGSMMLIDEVRAEQLYARMAAGIEASGGSAANTVAGVASLGGRSAYIGKVAQDGLGKVFAHDIGAIGVNYATAPLQTGAATARCLINVTPDGQRTMCTFLGASVHLTPDDVDPQVVESAKIIYLEGYLFDPPQARRAFAKAAGLARASGRLIALILANEAELLSLFETDDFGAAAKALRGRARLAAVTRGAQGSVVIAGDEIIAVDAVRVEKVVDTTGAGDQYAAGFLLGLANGRPLPICGRLGSIAAAEVISHYGPRPQTSLKDLALKAGL
jgi:sugar/nucleoside kinase (ribokinase family)